jgi:hypothetical protein
MRVPPVDEERAGPEPVRTRPAQVWRPSPSPAARVPGFAQPLRSRPPSAHLSHVESEIIGALEKQLEQITALNARTQRLLGVASITLGVLTLGVICLASLIVAA